MRPHSHLFRVVAGLLHGIAAKYPDDALDLHIGGNKTRANQKWYDDVVVAASCIGPKAGK